MTSPRVLIIASWYPAAESPTAGIFIQRQAEALAQVVDVAVIHVHPGSEDFGPTVTTEDGIAVVRSGVNAAGLTSRYFGYRRSGQTAFEALVAQWGTPGIVHVQAMFPAALIARDLKNATGIPYVITEHSEEYLPESQRRLARTPGVLPLLLRPLARQSSRTIAVSQHLCDRLSDLGLTVDPVVIPNVVARG